AVGGAAGHLHPSRLHPDRAPGRLQRLLLSVPRLAVRHLRPYPPRTRAGQSAAASLRVRLQHQDPDRLTAATSPQGSTMSGQSTYQPQNAALRWLERRLPIGGAIHSSLVPHPPPRHLTSSLTLSGL